MPLAIGVGVAAGLGMRVGGSSLQAATIFQATLDATNAGWATFTLRAVLELADLTDPGYAVTKIRVTVQGGSTEGWQLDNAYVGHKAAAGDAYDFAAAPTKLTFSGADGVTTGVGGSSVSDWVDFSWNRAAGLVISAYGSNSSADNIASLNILAPPSNRMWYKNASDASTVDATGYTNESVDLIGIAKVEVARVVG